MRCEYDREVLQRVWRAGARRTVPNLPNSTHTRGRLLSPMRLGGCRWRRAGGRDSNSFGATTG